MIAQGPGWLEGLGWGLVALAILVLVFGGRIEGGFRITFAGPFWRRRVNPYLVLMAIGALVFISGLIGYAAENYRGPLRWDFSGFLGANWLASSLPYVASFQVSGHNSSPSEVQITDAYIISAMTGERLPVTIRTDAGYVTPKDSNPIPSGAQFYMHALFYDPNKKLEPGEREGIPEDEFLKQWGGFSFVRAYHGRTYRTQFGAPEIQMQIDRVKPKLQPPRVTKLKSQ